MCSEGSTLHWINSITTGEDKEDWGGRKLEEGRTGRGGGEEERGDRRERIVEDRVNEGVKMKEERRGKEGRGRR
jgi:hypothetical protein